MDMSEGRKIETLEAHPRKLVFFSQEGLPAAAGMLGLMFANGGFKNLEVPERVANVVTFPSRAGELVYRRLLSGEQFVVTVAGRNWFGGTDSDGSVFLSEVTDVAVEALENGGEEAFYESLKPGALRALEREHPDYVTVRQGDIFAFWCPAYGKSMRQLFAFLSAQPFDTEASNPMFSFERREGRFSAENSRHTLAGVQMRAKWEWLSAEPGTSRCNHTENYFTGTLTAPDHPEIVLKHPHQLFRAANTIWPRNGGD